MTQHSIHDFLLAIDVDEQTRQVTMTAYDTTNEKFYLLTRFPMTQEAKAAWREHVNYMQRRN